MRRGPGRAAGRDRRASAARSPGSPAPVTALTATASTMPRLVPVMCSRACRVAGPGSARSAARDGEQAVPDAEGVDGGQVLLGLRHPAPVGRHGEQHRQHRADPGQHVRYEALMPGHVNECEPLAGQQNHRPAEPEVDGQPPAPLLGPPVRLHPGQRADQGGLAVVPRAPRWQSPANWFGRLRRPYYP